jgi:hypothetical protein
MSAATITRRLGVPCTALVLATLAATCGDSRTPVDPAADFARDDAALGAEAGAAVSTTGSRVRAATVNQELAALRSTTARFHRIEEAEAAGYTVLVTHPVTGAACLEDPPDGGMGRHFLNLSLVDEEVSVNEPEVVIYEPQSNGRLRLVGFEYIIPFAILGPGDTPPTLFGQEFLHNNTFDLWMLHVYAWKDNPSGMFATWNPKITCEHDQAVDG